MLHAKKRVLVLVASCPTNTCTETFHPNDPGKFDRFNLMILNCNWDLTSGPAVLGIDNMTLVIRRERTNQWFTCIIRNHVQQMNGFAPQTKKFAPRFHHV